MSSQTSLTTLDTSAFEMIEEAVAETARGRWFLAEYARRNRNADTEMLLGAIGKLEGAVTGERAPEGFGRLRGDLMEMAGAIARTKAEMAAISAPDHDQSRLGVASEALDAIVRATERATSDILGAAEEVQEAAWTLRETGADGAICDELDRRATQIYTACSFQDLTAQRIGRIVHTLRYLEERLIAMIAIWGEDEAVPPAPGASRAAEPILDDLCQSDVDRYIDMEAAQPIESRATRSSLPLHEDLIFVETQESIEPAAVAVAERAPEVAAVEDDLLDWAPAEPEQTPATDAEAVTQEESDDLAEADVFAAAQGLDIADEIDVVEMAAAEEAVATPADPEPAAEAPRGKTAAEPMPEFADLDDLSLEEKLALFT